MLYDGNAREQSRPQMERQDRLCRCGQILLLLGYDMVEIGDDCAEHAEAPEVVLAGHRRRNASHQEKPSNVGWRCPGSDTPFGFIVEQPFATNGRNAMLPERGEEFATAGISELVSAQSARNAPPQKLASKDRRRFRMSRAATRADLSWPRGDEAAR
jgi:hypothetical protein